MACSDKTCCVDPSVSSVVVSGTGSFSGLHPDETSFMFDAMRWNDGCDANQLTIGVGGAYWVLQLYIVVWTWFS